MNIPPKKAETATEKMLRALTKNLARMAEGNRLTVGQVRLSSYEEQPCLLKGHVQINLAPDIKESHSVGKSSTGVLFENKEAVMEQVFKESQILLSDPNIQQELANILRQEPEKGFQEKGFKHKLPHIPVKIYSTLGSCQYCNGQKEVSCQRCQSTGRMDCHTCHGQGTLPCNDCYSTGQKQGSDGNMYPCHSCQSTGQMLCMECNNTKKTQCIHCQGNGRLGCGHCQQTGCLQHHYHVTWRAHGVSNLFASTDMPTEVRDFIHKKTLGKIITEQHAQIEITPPDIAEGDRLSFAMTADMPFVLAHFSIDGKITPAEIIGYRGRILKMAPFLDPVIKPAIEALLKITRGKIAREALMSEACKWRIIRDALTDLESHSQKHVYQKIKKQYPFVVSDGYAKAIVTYGDKAIHSFAKGSRHLALGIASVFSLVTGFIYFKAGVLNTVEKSVGNGSSLALYNLFFWGLSYLFSLYLFKFIVQKALDKKRPASQTRINRKLPKAGNEGFILVLTSFIAFMIFSWI